MRRVAHVRIRACRRNIANPDKPQIHEVSRTLERHRSKGFQSGSWGSAYALVVVCQSEFAVTSSRTSEGRIMIPNIEIVRVAGGIEASDAS